MKLRRCTHPLLRAPYGAWGETPQVAAELGKQLLGWQTLIFHCEPPPADILAERLLDAAPIDDIHAGRGTLVVTSVTTANSPGAQAAGAFGRTTGFTVAGSRRAAVSASSTSSSL